VSATTLTCANCANDFPAPPVLRGGRVRRFCTPKCRVAGANQRRATTRLGRTLGPTNPHAQEPSGLPSSPTLPNMSPSVDRSASDRQDTPSDSLANLLDKAHSRVGVTAWEIATIAKMRGISAWAPVRVIIAR
jgi:hypothetical protein